MKFQFIWPGSHAEPEFGNAIEKYLGRIRHFVPVEILEVPPERGRQKKNDAAIMHAQSARLIEAIPSRGLRVVLDERGAMLDSLKFSKWLEKLTMEQPYGVNFIMGGDVGMDDSVRQAADKLIALSPMTMPHELARVVLLEQIYRACTLMRNIRYHK